MSRRIEGRDAELREGACDRKEDVRYVRSTAQALWRTGEAIGRHARAAPNCEGRTQSSAVSAPTVLPLHALPLNSFPFSLAQRPSLEPATHHFHLIHLQRTARLAQWSSHGAIPSSSQLS